MFSGLLSRREWAAWASAFIVVAALLVFTGFTSDDPDSALYANLSARLADGPVSRWIAPEWWGQWDSEGLFREHPAGVFLLPTALGWLGIPTVQAAYIVGVGMGLASLLLIASIVARVTSRDDGRIALALLQLMPIAFVFRIRANHEYPMLVCLLLTLIGLDGVRRSWWWVGLVAAALTAAMLIKAAFVVLIFLAAALWVLINPTRAGGSIVRPALAVAVSLGAMTVVALQYDAHYLGITGEAFWASYWQRQLGPLTLSTPIDGATTLIGHFWFYLIRLVWHPAPWSLGLAIVLWRRRGGLAAWWRTSADPERRGLLFALLFATAAILVLSPASRFAERYAFSANYAIAAAGVVVTARAWPAIRRVVLDVDARVPAFPVILWLLLIVLRLTIGPLMPRIT